MYYSVIYQSKAQYNFTSKDIELMLMRAKQKNKKNNITGCIVYANDKFIQLIQGPKDAILKLYDEIKADDRHFDVVTLHNQQNSEKIWSEWSMAMLDFTGSAQQVMNSRILLESYLENVNDNKKNSEAYKIFRSEVQGLINMSEKLA